MHQKVSQHLCQKIYGYKKLSITLNNFFFHSLSLLTVKFKIRFLEHFTICSIQFNINWRCHCMQVSYKIELDTEVTNHSSWCVATCTSSLKLLQFQIIECTFIETYEVNVSELQRSFVFSFFVLMNSNQELINSHLFMTSYLESIHGKFCTVQTRSNKNRICCFY